MRSIYLQNSKEAFGNQMTNKFLERSNNMFKMWRTAKFVVSINGKYIHNMKKTKNKIIILKNNGIDDICVSSEVGWLCKLLMERL